MTDAFSHQVLKRISREVAAQEYVQPGATPAPLAASTGPVSRDESVAYGAEPPFSFAQAAATAMARTPMLDPSVLPHMYEGAATAPDYSSFVNTLVSEDWTAGTFTSPGGDEASLLDQLAATWWGSRSLQFDFCEEIVLAQPWLNPVCCPR